MEDVSDWPTKVENWALQFAVSALLCPFERLQIYTQCSAALPEEKRLTLGQLIHQDWFSQFKTLPLLYAYRGIRDNFRPNFIKLCKIVGISNVPWTLRITEIVLFFPYLHLKTILIADAKNEYSVRRLYEETRWDNQGWRFFCVWRGLIPSCITSYRFQGPYKRFLDFLKRYSPWDTEEGAPRLICVATASMISGFLAYPIETLARRSQTRAFFQPSKELITHSCLSPAGLLKSALVEEIRWTFSNVQNVRSLYDGYWLELIQTVGPSIAIIITASVVKKVAEYPDLMERIDVYTLRRLLRRK